MSAEPSEREMLRGERRYEPHASKPNGCESSSPAARLEDRQLLVWAGGETRNSHKPRKRNDATVRTGIVKNPAMPTSSAAMQS